MTSYDQSKLRSSVYKVLIKLPSKTEFFLYGGLSLRPAIHRELLRDTFLEILANTSVRNFFSETGASSMKKFEAGLFSTSFSRSDSSAKKNLIKTHLLNIHWVFLSLCERSKRVKQTCIES
jgi:hypothetical protein